MAAQLDDTWTFGGAPLVYSPDDAYTSHSSYTASTRSDGQINHYDSDRADVHSMASESDMMDEDESGGVFLLDFESSEKPDSNYQFVQTEIDWCNQHHLHEETHPTPGTFQGGVQIRYPPAGYHDSESFQLNSLHEAHGPGVHHLNSNLASQPASSILTGYDESRPFPTPVSALRATVPDPIHQGSGFYSASVDDASATRFVAAQRLEDFLPRSSRSPSLQQDHSTHVAQAETQSASPYSSTFQQHPSTAGHQDINDDEVQSDTADQQHTSSMHYVPDMMTFLERWHMQTGMPQLGTIRLDVDRIRDWKPPSDSMAYDAEGHRDVQGLDWGSLHTDRKSARRARSLFYSPKGLYNTRSPSSPHPVERNFYSCKQMFSEHRAEFTHYQLRHTLAATGPHDVFYACYNKVKRTSLACPSVSDTVIDLSKSSLNLSRATADCHHITTIAASPAPEFAGYVSDSVLVTGGFEGEYTLLNLHSSSDEPPIEGFVTNAMDGITTHIHTLEDRRNGALSVAFCSNDRKLRILDVETNRFTRTFEYSDPVNCAATAPDGRLRVIVGDTKETLITDAERGNVLVRLQNHTDDAFACAWAQDGWHVATGAQDGKVVVYDARNWSVPIIKLDCEVGCARSLQFTNTSSTGGCGGGGGGAPPALVVAESDDIVSIYDSRDWNSKQTIDFFGSVAGIALISGGRELVVANGDDTVGGLMTFERRDDAFFASHDCYTSSYSSSSSWSMMGRRGRR